MSEKSELVTVSKSSDGITIITINRPAVRNAVNSATATQLADAVDAFEADAEQKVCILTGTGDTFCAGYDLHEVAAPGRGALSAHHHPVEGNKLSGTRGPMGPSRTALSKPLIAAVAGHAVAGGLELALLADLRVADETAVFGVFCRRFGVPLIDGGTVRLTRVIGLGRALDLILTGRPVDAREALAIGLANRVVAKGRALEEARRLAEGLLRFPQLCMRADRASVYHAAFDAASLAEALRFEYATGSRVLDVESVAGATRFHKGEGRSGSFTTTKAKI